MIEEDLDDIVEEDLDEPEHEISTSGDRERLLAAAMAHAEVQDEQYKQPLAETEETGLWKTPLALVVLLLAGYIAIAPPGWLFNGPTRQITATDLERGEVAALTVQAEQIAVFQIRNGRLPRSLDEVPVQLPQIRYVRSNSRTFQLIAAQPNGTALIYDFARVDERFVQAREGLISVGGS